MQSRATHGAVGGFGSTHRVFDLTARADAETLHSYALPKRQRHLTALILRKLSASSSRAIAATLDTLRSRLEALRDERIDPKTDLEFTEQLIEAEDIESELLDEILADEEDGDGNEEPPAAIDRRKLTEEIDVIERWADDRILSVEKVLTDTKESIKALHRQAQLAVALDEQKEIQERIRNSERQQRRQRQEIFDAEDEITGKRDQHFEALECRVAQKITAETLFSIGWRVA